MKRLTIAAVVGLALMAAPAIADTVKVTDYDGTWSNNATAGGGYGGAYKAFVDGDTTGFITFCLEADEYLSVGKTYYFTTSDSARNGGVNVAGPGADALSDATKWLYYQVRSGNYVVTGLNAYAGPSFHANVQYAIWLLENEITSANSTATAIRDLALAGNWSALFAAGHRVQAMNLRTVLTGTPEVNTAQDLLTHSHVPVPEPASLALLGIGLLGVAARLRRRGRQRDS